MIDNPVARLRSLLEAGKAISIHQNCRETWMHLLDASTEDELMFKLGIVMQLPKKINKVLADNLEPELWKTAHWEPMVKRAFFEQNLNGSWDTFIGKISETGVGELRLLQTIIHVKGEYKALTDNDLLEFKMQLNLILEDIIASDINKAIKDKVCRYLRKIITAIEDYQISGIEPVEDAVNTLVGSAAFDKEYQNFLSDDRLGGQIIKVIGALADSVAIVQGLPPVAAPLLGLVSGKGV
ncbi:Uncharacterised protein [Serratia marcescens]|nr:Uncharacterised protein [Serratia marcescens]CAI2059821.1 Uncharacterised protein [Serratia marcescens]